MHNLIETMRAFTISAYSRGAGSVYLFNHFGFKWFEKKYIYTDGSTKIVNDKPLILKEGGKLSTVIDKPRRHVLTFTDPDINGKDVEVSLPSIITKEKPGLFRIYTGPRTQKSVYIVRIGLESLEGFREAEFAVKVNNHISTPINDMTTDWAFIYKNITISRTEVVKNVSEIAPRVMQFKADPKYIQNGYNDITVSNQRDDEQRIIWLEVYME